MAKSPERSLFSDVWQAHQLAGKIHADGAKPVTRLGGAAAITATGVALEMISRGSTKLVQEKFPSIKFDKLPLFQELLEDGVVGVVYAVANKQLNEPLPKLKLRHLTTSTLGSVLVMGAEGIEGKIDAYNTKRKTDALKKAAKLATSTVASGTSVAASDTASSAAAPSTTVSAAPDAESVTAAADTSNVKIPDVVIAPTEKKRSILDYINPVTALGADEARMAVMDWYRAYKAVVNGTEEEFVKTNKPKDPKEPTLMKETTMIYVVPDLAAASAMVNTTTGETVATS